MRIVTCDCCGQRMDHWVTITPEVESVNGIFDDTFYYTSYTARKELCETCFKQFLKQIESGRKDQ